MGTEDVAGTGGWRGRRLPPTVAALAVAVAQTACTRLPHLASGPIELGPTPTLVRFDAAVAAAVDDFTLCFEFRLPRESEDARRIVATFVTPSRQRYVFATSELDRRGEFVVCRIGRMSPAGETAGSEPPRSFTAVELSADTPLRLRGLRGGPTVEAS
jgi:hypothetical protein